MPIFISAKIFFFHFYFFSLARFFFNYMRVSSGCSVCGRALYAMYMQRGRREKGGGGGRGFKDIYSVHIFSAFLLFYAHMHETAAVRAISCKVRGGGGGCERGEGYFTQYTAGAKPTDSVPMRIKQE